MTWFRRQWWSAIVLVAACSNEPLADATDAGDMDGGGPGPTTSGDTTSSPPVTTTDSASTTSPATATDDTMDGTSFLVMDMGEGGGVCDVYAQDCPKGEKCMPWAADGGNAWNSTTCVPVAANPGQVGDPCTVDGSAVSGIDDCDLGLMCYNVSAETNTGTCYELCGGSPAAPACSEGLCAVYNEGNLPLCLEDCDPILQDCSNAQLCLASPSANGFVCILDALPGFVGDHGAPCEFVNACDPGLFCALPNVVPGCTNAGGCCAEFCDVTLPDPSSACTRQAQGQECLPWYGVEAPPPGYEHVGFCGLP